MVISHERKFIFFHNPKTAGSSLRFMLMRFHDDAIYFGGISPAPGYSHLIDYMHLRLPVLQTLHPRIIEAADSYASLILVRDPRRRFISAVDQHFRTFRAQDELAALSADEQVRIVRSFIADRLTHSAVARDPKLVHFSPQVWFIKMGDRQVPRHVVPMDDRGAFVPRCFDCLGLPPVGLPHVNRSSLDLAHLLQAPEINDFLHEFYAEDYAYFGADPALAHLIS